MRKRPNNVIDHLPELRRYAKALTRHSQDAEDLVQDALTRAYDRRGSFRIGAALMPWLMTILHNTFVDGLRSRQARLKTEGALDPLSEALPANQEDAVHLSQIRKAFLSLPDDQREALHLVAMEGLTYPEAAQVLGVPEGTVLSRVSRARQMLKAIENAPPVPHLRIVGGPNG